MTISQGIPQPLITNISLKMTYIFFIQISQGPMSSYNFHLVIHVKIIDLCIWYEHTSDKKNLEENMTRLFKSQINTLLCRKYVFLTWTQNFNPLRTTVLFRNFNSLSFTTTMPQSLCPDIKGHVANMGPTWVLSDPDGPLVDPMNLVIRVHM